MSQVRMIDVSANNHIGGAPIDWAEVVAAGYEAVMIKATEGINYRNPFLAVDARGAKAAGLLAGYYHYRHPGLGAPENEAGYALATIAGLPRDLGLAQDLEVTEGCSWGVLARQAQEFHDVARKVVDHSPLYCDDNFLTNLTGAPWGWRLWVAQTVRPRFQFWAWQQTTPVAVPGIPGLTDVGWLENG